DDTLARGGCLRAAGAALPRQRDLALPLRESALDAPPDHAGFEVRGVAVGAGLELRDELLGLVHAPAWGLGLAAHVLVARPLCLDPRLLEVRHEGHGAIHAALEVCVPRPAEEIRPRVEHHLRAAAEIARQLQPVLELPRDLR